MRAASLRAVVTRLVLAGAFIVVATVFAAVMERRRRLGGAPIGDSYPMPRQLRRADFARPDASWLVAVFSSETCESCVSMLAKARVLEGREVAVCEVSYQRDRELHERYGISGVPMVLVADADGVVRRGFVGPTSATDLWAAVAGVRDPQRDPEPRLGALA